jgi:hypothetical protein
MAKGLDMVMAKILWRQCMHARTAFSQNMDNTDIVIKTLEDIHIECWH